MVLSCWASSAFADLHVGGVTGRAESGVVPTSGVKPHTSADFLFRMNATPEEDYQAGLIAFKRGELIEAEGIFERAAKKGHTGAMVRLAEMLDRYGFVREALTWNLKAARLGNADAEYKIGQMYMDLNDYDLKRKESKIDPVSAYKWFKMSAEGGNKDAIALIASAYVAGAKDKGISDAERTDAEILKWVNQDITVNDSVASMQVLAKAYREGKYGLAVDTKKADEWDAKIRAITGAKDDSKKKKKKQRL
jgi:TPR repeat protein